MKYKWNKIKVNKIFLIKLNILTCFLLATYYEIYLKNKAICSSTKQYPCGCQIKKVVNLCGRQNSQMDLMILAPYNTCCNLFLLNDGQPGDIMGYVSNDYVTLYGKRDFTDVIKVSNQLTLSPFKWNLYWVGPT